MFRDMGMGIVRLNRCAAAVAAVLLLTACGGGGGGGGNALRPDGEGTTPGGSTPTTRTTPVATDGSGVVVAVLDSGVRISHDEFDNGARVLNGYNVADGNSDVSDMDSSSHGTRVASVALGSSVGVATGATLLPVRIIKSDGTFTTDEIAAGIDYARSRGAPINNISATVYDTHSIRNAVEASAAAGILTVAAAGNGGSANPIPAPLLQNVSADAVAHFLVVGAVDADDRITYWSDRAGTAMNRYLVAPGTSVPTALNNGDDRYGSASGTSFSSPRVAGAAALVKGADPALSMRQVADILLRSADDLGDPGVDPIYGWGKLNPERALQPLGTLAIPDTERAAGSAAAAASTALRLGRAFGDALRDAGPLSQVVALDDYQRPYHLNAAAAVSAPTSAVDLEGAMTSLSREQGRAEVHWGGLRLTGSWEADRPQRFHDPLRWDQEPQVHQRTLAVGGNLGSLAWEWTDGAAPAARFGAGALGPVQQLPWLLGAGPRDGYLALVDADAEGLSMTAGTAQGLDLRFGFFDGDNALTPDERPVRAGIAEAGYSHGRLQLRLSASQVHEQQGLLSSAGDGALTTGQGALTDSVGLAGRWQLGPDTALLGHYQAGRTRVSADGRGMLRDWSSIYSDTWGVGAVHQGLWRDDDYLGLSWRRPLRVNRGSVTIDAPVHRDLDYNIVRVRSRAELSPSGTEHNLELTYGFGLRHGGRFNAGMIYRIEPGHVRGADPDWGVMMGLQRPF